MKSKVTKSNFQFPCQMEKGKQTLIYNMLKHSNPNFQSQSLLCLTYVFNNGTSLEIIYQIGKMLSERIAVARLPNYSQQQL